VVCNGSTGAQGPQGIPGATGATGATGANGVNSLIQQDIEAPGANCPTGGVRIESGLDLNGNGILEANEVTQTSYTCNGQNGANGQNGSNGQNGLTSLIATTPEPAGANCANGGVAVQTGLDLNNDGILQSTEVQHTLYVCNGTNVGCSGGLHDNGTGTCLPTGCATGYHNGGDGTCHLELAPRHITTTALELAFRKAVPSAITTAAELAWRKEPA
jgi:hypothetical protein